MSIQCNASSFENQNNLYLIIIKRITYYKLHNFLDKRAGKKLSWMRKRICHVGEKDIFSTLCSKEYGKWLICILPKQLKAICIHKWVLLYNESSIMDTLYFLINIHGPQCVVNQFRVHRFVDDNDLQKLNISLVATNKRVKYDLNKTDAMFTHILPLISYETSVFQDLSQQKVVCFSDLMMEEFQSLSLFAVDLELIPQVLVKINSQV